jgi:bla regulator protein BlaR1
MMHNLSGIAKDLAPAIANHLWQSTLFAVVAGLLTLTLRRNQASIRYSLWLAASAKFLVPFSLLTILGAHLAIPHTAGPQTTVYTVVVQASQPFTQPSAPAIPPSPLLALLPEALALLWLAGFVVVLARWVLRWRRIFAATRRASRISSGREVEALRHLELAAAIKDPIPFLLSQDSMEPGVFGVAHPVLLWPAGISTHLHDTHLKAILAHEVWHVRRRDNLAAALHMFVEAVFWFYPLVWWIGARLIDERERACDEAVLAIGNEPEVYAESILKACEFCVESPLSCVSGVTGSNLKKRIVRIMTQQLAKKLSRARKLMLATAGIAAITAPIAIGIIDTPIVHALSIHTSEAPVSAVVAPSAEPQAPAEKTVASQMRLTVLAPLDATTHAPQTADGADPAYEVVTLKPHASNDNMINFQILPTGFSATNITVRHLIEFAYNIKDQQLAGGPGWIDTDKYDIELKTSSPNHPQRLIQMVLADRFNLRMSQETKTLPVYALVVANSGSKLIESTPPTVRVSPGSPEEPLISIRSRVQNGTGEVKIIGPVSGLADALSSPLGRHVVDKTGLGGTYDITLNWLAGANETESISTALQEKLGLQLEPQQGPVTVSVIDRIDQPSAN